MASTLCQKWFLKTRFFVMKLIFITFRTIQFGSNFTSMWSKYVSNNLWRDFGLPVSEFATVARKSFDVKFTAKNDFPIAHFMSPLLILIGSQNFFHALFNKYLDQMLRKVGW